MNDLRPIHTLLAQVRRRLRWQAAVETATTAAIVGVAAALVVLWLWRMELIARGTAWIALAATGGAVLVAAVAGALGRHATAKLAARVDRASNLADRLGTAVDFDARLRSESDLHPDTRALMQAAIADGLASTSRANVKGAAPFHAPRDLRALATFGGVAVAVTLLAFGPSPRLSPRDALGANPVVPNHGNPEQETPDPDDLAYQRDFVNDMKQLAEQTHDQDLAQMAKDLDGLLEKAKTGQISKAELLAQMDALEKKYTEATSPALDATVAALKDQGKELKKNEVTKRLGEALEAGDLQAAQKELERLADEVEKNQLSPEEQKQLADALQKAVEKHDQQQQQDEKKDQHDQQKAEQQIQKQKDEIRKLEKKLEQQPKNEEAKRSLEKQKRELDKIERDQKDKQDQQKNDESKRHLDRISRDMKQAAEHLKNQNNKDQSQNKDQQQEQRKQGAESMRNSAQESQKLSNQQQRRGNQQKVKSQLGDLKDAIRRAKPNKGQGQGQQQARNARISEWEKRAGGQQGNPSAWQKGQGQPGQQPGGDQPGGKPGQGPPGQPGGKQWGDEHDPNLQSDDPTAHSGHTIDDQLKGEKGAGPSRRETIITSAKKGFATTGYRNVYADYKKIVEEVMNQEKVPQGYKYYVKRYFQRIKPHAMD